MSGDFFMGRLSEYINAPSPSSPNGSDVEVSGIIENQAMFERLLTNEPNFDRNIRGLIRKALREARNNLSKDARSYIANDPRKAARAVKSAVYKELFGGNLSILQKRRSGAKYELKRHRKVEQNPKMWGGNRRKVDTGTDAYRLDRYYGADRGFILRFINGGTVSRMSRYGNRGSIRQTNWFGHTAPWQMESAAERVAEAINGYIKEQANG
jgi:hypothetical protein